MVSDFVGCVLIASREMCSCLAYFHIRQKLIMQFLAEDEEKVKIKVHIVNILQLYLAAFPTAVLSICTLLETGLTENDLFTIMANSELFSSFKHHFYSSTCF